MWWLRLLLLLLLLLYLLLRRRLLLLLFRVKFADPLLSCTGSASPLAGMNACVGVDRLQEARALLKSVSAAGEPRDARAYNILLKHYARAGDAAALPQLLSKMELKGVEVRWGLWVPGALSCLVVGPVRWGSLACFWGRASGVAAVAGHPAAGVVAACSNELQSALSGRMAGDRSGPHTEVLGGVAASMKGGRRGEQLGFGLAARS